MFRLFEWKSDNICQLSLVTGHNQVGLLLNGVAPGLVQRVHLGQVFLDDGFRQDLKNHLAGHPLVEFQPVTYPSHRQTGKHGMCAPAEQAKHGPRFSRIRRFVEHRVAHKNRRIRPQHRRLGVPGRDPVGLERSIMQHHGTRIGIGRLMLDYFRR